MNHVRSVAMCDVTITSRLSRGLKLSVRCDHRATTARYNYLPVIKGIETDKLKDSDGRYLLVTITSRLSRGLKRKLYLELTQKLLEVTITSRLSRGLKQNKISRAQTRELVLQLPPGYQGD